MSGTMNDFPTELLNLLLSVSGLLSDDVSLSLFDELDFDSELFSSIDTIAVFSLTEKVLNLTVLRPILLLAHC